MVGGVKPHIKSNPIPAGNTQRAQIKPCAHQEPGNPQETKPDLPLNGWVSSVEAWIRQWPAAGTGALGAADLGGVA